MDVCVDVIKKYKVSERECFSGDTAIFSPPTHSQTAISIRI